MYLGVPVDWVKAYAWLSLAAAQGDEDAVKFKVQLRPKMTTEQVAESEKLAAALRARIEASESE